MNTTPTDRIEKLVNLDATRHRVWRALTEVPQFNAWFGCELTGTFTPGEEINGIIRFKDTEFKLTLLVKSIEPETLFSFRWHPYAIEPGVDYSHEPTTLVSFTLEDAGQGGTSLRIVESGFDAIPEARRAKAFSMNSAGWDGQSRNIQKYLAARASDADTSED